MSMNSELSLLFSGPYIGQAILYFAALVAGVSILLPLSLERCRQLYWVQVLTIMAAFVWLIKGHLVSDFSLLNVVKHSHTQKPWLYKLAGVWGNHEGSMLLWTMLLSLVGLLAFRRSDSKIPLIHFSLFNFGFCLFLIFACDPFAASLATPGEGRDLNPILQDPLLAIHPPILYFGYVSCAAPFVMALLPVGIRSLPLWTLWSRIAWVFLTMGVGLGSFWAYYELGWGGWWFWDPVENVALIPWLLVTALVHSLILHTRGQVSVRWPCVLSFATFSSCLLGTFVVRSGLLMSVHSFALDPERGIFLGILIALIALVSFPPLVRSMSIKTSPYYLIDLSLPSLMKAGVILISFGALVVLFGTSYPLILQLFDKVITVGAPYFNKTFVPMMLPVLALMAAVPWVKGSGKSLQNLFYSSFLIGALGAVGLVWLGQLHGVVEILVLVCVLWLLVSMGMALVTRQLPLKQIAMIVSHVGLGVMVLGMLFSTVWEQEKLVSLKPGESVSFAGQTITLTTITPKKASNHMAQEATLTTDRGVILKPEKRFYWTQGIIHNETAIHSGLFHHLYVTLGEQYDNGAWGVKLYHKPWINLLWFGVILMALGGVFALIRKGVRRKKTALAVFWMILGLAGDTQALEIHEQLSLGTLESRAKSLGDRLICPTCVGQTLNDSVAEEAQLLREVIRQQLLKGYSDQQVIDWFVERYGDRVLLEPTLGLSTMALWGLPWLGLVLLMGLIYLKHRRQDG